MHFDSNVVFLLLLGVAALFKWLTQKAQESAKKSDETKREETSQSSQTHPSAPAGSEEERIRRFLEALGQPSSSAPPRKITPRPTASPKQVVLPHVGPWASPLPPLTTQPPLVEPTPPVSATLPPPLPTPVPARVTPKPIEAPVFEVRRAQSSSSSRDPVTTFPSANIPVSSRAPLTTSSVLTLLASADGLRQAVILREIFGPPRSLQELS
jgi:hypothetical protein